MEPIINISGYFINLRNVAFINYYSRQIIFNYECNGKQATLNCSHVDNFKQIIQEQLDKLNTKVFN